MLKKKQHLSNNVITRKQHFLIILLLKQHFDFIIIDEAHNLRKREGNSQKVQVFPRLLGLIHPEQEEDTRKHKPKVLFLSATPMIQSDTDFLNQISFAQKLDSDIKDLQKISMIRRLRRFQKGDCKENLLSKYVYRNFQVPSTPLNIEESLFLALIQKKLSHQHHHRSK